MVYRINVNASDLTATFTINFSDNSEMYSAFSDAWPSVDCRWPFNDNTHIATFEFNHKERMST